MSDTNDKLPHDLAAVDAEEPLQDQLGLTDEQVEALKGVDIPADAIKLTDERAQREIDLQLVYGAVQQARRELASAKLTYHLALAGVKGGQHPKQIREVVAEKRNQLDTVITLATFIEEHEGDGIPEPSALEIASEMP